MRLCWLGLVALTFVHCGRGEKESKDAPATRYFQTADASVPLAEFRGRRLCAQVFPADDVAAVVPAPKLVAPSGYSRASGRTLRCLYLWPESGGPEITIELNLDCRELRPTTEDLARFWPSAEVLEHGLFYEPAPSVQQLHGALEPLPCYLSITTGFVQTRMVEPLFEVARGRIDPRILIALRQPDE